MLKAVTSNINWFGTASIDSTPRLRSSAVGKGGTSSKPSGARAAPDTDFQTGSSGEVAYRQCKPYFSSCPEPDFRRDASRTLVGRGRGYGTPTTSAESSLKSCTSHWHMR